MPASIDLATVTLEAAVVQVVAGVIGEEGLIE